MVLSGRLLLPLALGVSLVAVSAAVAYYLLRREDEEEEGAAGAGGGAHVKSGRMNIIEVSVPKNIVPALIGRAGSNIKEIEKKSGASIVFKKFPDRDADICLIRGRSEATQLAETMVHEYINNQPEIVEETMTVPTWACGRIIGTRGENINDISHRSGARVKVESGGAAEGAQRAVSLRGTRAQIQLARGCIEKCVAQQKCLLEINESRSPRLAPGPDAAEPAGDATSLARHAKSKRPGGSSIEVYVSAVSSPSRFWVQFVGAQVAQLDALVDRTTEYYNNRDNRETHALKEVSVGQVVAAVFRHDGRWYRARVDAIRQNEFAPEQQVADVFFLDYGDSEYVATNELCELRSDLLRLRFQAMECFLAGVRPAGREEDAVRVSPGGARWHKWDPRAVQRFEELSKVARWKSLVSVTCTYKRGEGAAGERDVPGIKLYDVTDDGEVDIGATLVAEGWAAEAPVTPRASPAPSPRAAATPPPPAAPAPFGDLGASRVLGMLESETERAASLPRDPAAHPNHHAAADGKPTSTSLASGLNTTDPRPDTPKTQSDLSYPSREGTPQRNPTDRHMNGTHNDFLSAERQSLDGRSLTSSAETVHHLPMHLTDPRDELKANMNRIDSHHGNLEALGRDQPE